MNFKNLKRRVVLLGMMMVTAGQAVPPKPEIADPAYILRPNDSISLTIYQEPDLSGSVRLLRTGQASFPLIGLVSLSGLSVSQATKKIHDLYAEKYLVDPKVTLAVDGYATEFVSVLGAVRSPGQVAIPVSGNLDLATAMASAGGLAADADKASVQLTRVSGGTATYNMDSIESGASGRVQLNSGDRIIVNKSTFIGKSVTVLGAVGKPGPLPFPLDGNLDLVGVIAFAGGMTEMANPRKVTINRKGTILKVDFKDISQRGDRQFKIFPDDVITVAERIF
jgi:polysaccharide export outer membrane protein